MMPRRAAVVAGILYALPPATPQASTCEFVEVTGGASPGSYALQSDGEGHVYTNGETGAVLLYTTSSIRRGRRRRLAEGEWLPPADNTAANGNQHTSLSGVEGLVEETIGWRRQQQGQGGGAERRRRSLAECASGFWINLSAGDSSGRSSSAGSDSPSLDGVAYPVYVAPDCADHPVNVTTEWFSIGCATCELEPASPTLSIECDEDYDNNGGGATPAPTRILTPDGTPAPSAESLQVQGETLPPTPAPTTTPAPERLATPATSTESPPEQVETLSPTPAPTTTPGPERFATPAPSAESLPEQQVETIRPTGVSTTTPAPERLETSAPSAEGGGFSAVPAVGSGVTPSPESSSTVADGDGEGSAAASGTERVRSGALGWLVAAGASAALLPSLFSSS
ncbi:unnamed protein product [Ectocarpus sp. 6 AP-2014]